MFRPLLSAVLAVVTAGALAACSGDDPAEPETPATPTEKAADAAPAVPTTATIGTVTGRLSKADRAQVRTNVTRAVDAWIDAAYVGGDYPRNDFRNAFSTFTAGARQRAVRDRTLMSNAGVGARIDTVKVLNRRLRIDVLAPGGRAAGVTAAIALGLGLQFTGDLERRERIAGNLYLTREDGRWRVFGYDVRRGAV